MITFVEKDLSGGWAIAVENGGATLGHIRRHADGSGFVYFSGPHNRLNWSYEEEELDVLKSKIERSLK